MSDDSINQNLALGAAVVAAVLGAMAAIIGTSDRHTKPDDHSNKAFNKNMLLGGVAGGIVGAVAALLLAPKAGSELIKDIGVKLNSVGHSLNSSDSVKQSVVSSQKSASGKAAAKKIAIDQKRDEETAEVVSSKSSKVRRSPPKKKAIVSKNLTIAKVVKGEKLEAL